MKSKRILLSVLLVAIIATSAFAQSDRIVVSGKTPLRASQIAAVVEFYEWAFETAFTEAERERFEGLSIEYHKQNPEGSAKETETMVKALAVVKSKDAAKQAEMRRSFTDGFVADLRKVDNAAAQLLLPIYERSRPDASRSSVPAKSNGRGGALVGRWIRRGGSGGSRDYTGKTLYNNSNDAIFEFRADGTVKFINDKKTLSITQCKMSELMELPGRYTVSGSTLTMEFAAGKHVSTSTCDASRNFNKTVPAEKMVKQFVVKNMESIFRPDAPLILCLDGEADDKCFEVDK